MAVTKKQIIRVIIISFIAVSITTFLLLMIFRVQIIPGRYFYLHFDHVGSLTVGAVVRTAGVRIGTVSNIEINKNDYQTVIVTATLYPGQEVKRDSRFLVMSGSLIGDQYVEVLPGKGTDFIQDGEVFRGEPIKNLDSFLLSSDTLIKDFTTTMSILSEILRDNKGNIEKTLQNIRDSSDALKNSLAGSEGKEDSLLKKMDIVFGNLEKTTTSLTNILDGFSSKDSVVNLLNQKDTSADVRQTLSNLKQISESLVSVTADLKTLLDSLVGPTPSVPDRKTE
jgi:phospholipid/cholesterol/gamma-HCH transport system substrate-binding protein